jgi:hypothetical protein
MALTTGTISAYGSEFHFPSGTVIYAAQVLGFPDIAMGERNTTHHGSGGKEERQPNGLVAASDFTLSLIAANGHTALHTARDAGTVNLCFLKGKVFTYLFQGWIKSIKEEDADASSPDSSKLTVVVTPAGGVTISSA